LHVARPPRSVEAKGGAVLASPQAEEHSGPNGGEQTPLSPEFVTRVAGAQRALFAYIRSLAGPWAEPEDILQEVNLVLCRKAHEYDGRGQFLTWACRVAYFQVLAHMKQRQRDKHQYYDEALLEDLAGPLAEQVENVDSRLEALRHCLGQLSDTHRQMVLARYARGGSVQKIADDAGR